MQLLSRKCTMSGDAPLVKLCFRCPFNSGSSLECENMLPTGANQNPVKKDFVYMKANKKSQKLYSLFNPPPKFTCLSYFPQLHAMKTFFEKHAHFTTRTIKPMWFFWKHIFTYVSTSELTVDTAFGEDPAGWRRRRGDPFLSKCYLQNR